MHFKKAITALFFTATVRLSVASDAGMDGVCEPNPCGNDGRCVPEGTEFGYVCQCSIGFYGPTCEETNDDLTLSQIALSTAENSGSYEISSWEQEHPQQDTCPCENNGMCAHDKIKDSGYVCLCTPGWSGKNCQESADNPNRFLRVHSESNNEDKNVDAMSIPDARLLQTRQSSWACIRGQFSVSVARIWWGHTSGDGLWACNNWNKALCAGQCTASKFEITSSSWDCYYKDGLVAKPDGVNIWWGHTAGDGAWACSNWLKICKDRGGCTAKNFWYSDGSNTYYTRLKF